MTKILGLSGKKQSGKSTAANWIIGQQMCSVAMVSWIRINDKGKLVVPAVINDELSEGIFDPTSPNPEIQNLLAQYVWPVVKLYSFADILKMSTIAIFGLTYEQVNGTDEQKNQPTKFKWSDFDKFLSKATKSKAEQTGLWDKPMTGRHILQVVGTDIFRRIYGDIWVDACIRQIKLDAPELAVVIDCRFPNEINGIHKEGGKVVRFTRAPFASNDEHASETALDQYDNFDHTINNSNMTIEEQNKEINEILSRWKFNTWEWQV